MLAVVLMTVLSLAVGALVLAYVAYPHQGQEVPRVPWLGAWMRSRVERLPLIPEDEGVLLSDDDEPLLRNH